MSPKRGRARGLITAVAAWIAVTTSACGADEPAPGFEPELEPTCLQAVVALEGDDPLSYGVAWSPVSGHVLGGTTFELRLLFIDGALDEDGRALRVVDRYRSDTSHLSIAWTSDGALALSAGGDGQIHLFEVDLDGETLEHVNAIRVDTTTVYDVAISPDERYVLGCGHGGELTLLRLDRAAAALTIVDRVAAHERCVIARWSPSGRHAASLGRAETTMFWELDAERERLVAIAALESGEEPGAVAFGADDSEVVHGTFGAGHRVAVLRLDPDAGQLEPLQAFDDFASGIKVIEPDLERHGFVIAAHDEAPRLYLREEDGSGLRLVARMPDDRSGSHAVSWSPDGLALVRAASQLDRFEVIDMRACP